MTEEESTGSSKVTLSSPAFWSKSNPLNTGPVLSRSILDTRKADASGTSCRKLPAKSSIAMGDMITKVLVLDVPMAELFLMKFRSFSTTATLTVLPSSERSIPLFCSWTDMVPRVSETIVKEVEFRLV